jgi:hypothetical protein
MRNTHTSSEILLYEVGGYLEGVRDRTKQLTFWTAWRDSSKYARHKCTKFGRKPLDKYILEQGQNNMMIIIVSAPNLYASNWVLLLRLKYKFVLDSWRKQLFNLMEFPKCFSTHKKSSGELIFRTNSEQLGRQNVEYFLVNIIL